MPHADTLVLFMAAALALNLTPGPDMLYVIARSTGEGRAAGVASAFGIALGCLVHIGALAAGLSALLTRVPSAYHVVRIAGALYLGYLGIRALTSSRTFVTATLPPARSAGAIVLQGCVTNILNPKVALFFLAFIPQFVRPDGWSPAVQVVALGLLFNGSGTMVNLAVALAASRATGWLRTNQATATWLQRTTGVVFLGLGMRLALVRDR
jgi:threonine/homoserine/homoserine lactone efflux protein